MNGSAWTLPEIEKLHELKAAGTTWAEISVTLKRSVGSCRKVYNNQGILASQPIVQALVESHAKPADLWRDAEKDNAAKVEHAAKQTQFIATFKNSIGITFVSDQHIAPGTPVDMKRMREDAEFIRKTPNLYCILGGDALDNHVKHRAAILAARSQPDDQWTLFEHYLSILAPKVLVVISGNHESWTNQIAGVDVLKMLANQQKVRYSPHEAHLDVKVGSQLYRVAVRHQSRFNSSFNQTHAVKQWLRLGDFDWDIGCICHHHEPALEHFIAKSLARVAIRPGSYQIVSAYQRQYGFPMGKPACPTIWIDAKRRKITGWLDVRDLK